MIDKQMTADFFDGTAPHRRDWFYRNRTYHAQLIEVVRPYLNPSSRVLELGCSTGDLLHELGVKHGVGVDISPRSIAIAEAHYPDHTWICADIEHLPDHPALVEPFDIVLVSDVVGYLHDIGDVFERLHGLVHTNSRVVVSTWNWLWQPALAVAEALRLKAPDLQARQNWVSTDILDSMLTVADFDVIEHRAGLLFPYHLPMLSEWINALSYAPLFRRLALLHTIVARPAPVEIQDAPSVTVLIPTRNERGNIAALVERVPDMGSHTELLFVDGDSTDGTVEEIHAQIAAHPERDIKFMAQTRETDTPADLMLKSGKGAAVRQGFDAAACDILMILDSDISVLPEALPRFYTALAKGHTRFANGTRFLYEQQAGAMRPANRAGNVFFSLVFSWLLGQRVTDTLCGTKVLFKSDYERLKVNRSYFGDFDPFGDFDLLFGAAWMGLPIIDIPVHYQARVYGESKVRIQTHGPLLGQMGLLALWQFKIRPLLSLRRQAPAPVPGRETRKSGRRAALVVAGLLLAVGMFRVFRGSQKER